MAFLTGPCAALAALAAAWANVVLAGRWAQEPGALHGWRLYPYLALLALTTVALVWSWRRPGVPLSMRDARFAAAAGGGLLATAFLAAFPVSRWTEVPIYDDWPGRLQLTLDGIDTLRHGAVVGWQWAFLGGYHTSADLSQSLALPSVLPIALAGPNVGFHLFLALITLAIPVAAWRDIASSDGRAAGAFAGGVTAIVTSGYFATVMYNGMANSTAGAAGVAMALYASHAARRGRRWGGPLLAVALTLTLYSHAAFYAYGTLCLGIEALYYRDLRGSARAVVALAVAFVAALPLHWELLRYPEWFAPNNLYFEAPPTFDWRGLLQQIWYATEMLWQPGRWFNDYGGLTYIWLLPLAWLAWRDRTRAGFYAWASIGIVVSLRLNSPQLGLMSSRQFHLLPVVVGPAIAGFIAGHAAGGRFNRALLTATIACFMAVPFSPVPHVPDIHAFDPALVDRISEAGGHLVLVENNPHWDMINDPARRTEKSRFDSHYEALLPAATGKLFFGQQLDGYHRSVFRGHSLAGGGYRGRAIDEVPPPVFASELRRWGVQTLFVWSDASTRHLAASPLFERRWRHGPWQQFDLVDADPRSVVTTAGRGTLGHLTPIGGDVVLADVPAGSPVVVRTHYFPAWRAEAAGRDVALRSIDGQIAFDAPPGEAVTVRLAYDRRSWLTALALGTLLAGLLVLYLFGYGPSRSRSGRDQGVR